MDAMVIDYCQNCKHWSKTEPPHDLLYKGRDDIRWCVEKRTDNLTKEGACSKYIDNQTLDAILGL